MCKLINFKMYNISKINREIDFIICKSKFFGSLRDWNFYIFTLSRRYTVSKILLYKIHVKSIEFTINIILILKLQEYNN